MKELQGLTKEEKLALMEEKRIKFRAQKSKNEIEEKLERARKDREAIKAQADLKAKREEHQIKMAMEAKKREKLRNKKRKDAAREKIRNLLHKKISYLPPFSPLGFVPNLRFQN